MTRLWYLNANGSNSREISLVRPLYSHFTLAGWSADGEHILLWIGGVSASIAADGLPLVSVSVTSGDHQRVTEEMLAYKEYVAMSPVGNSVLVISGGNREAWTNKRLIAFNTVTGNIMANELQIDVARGQSLYLTLRKTDVEPAVAVAGNVFIGNNNPALPPRLLGSPFDTWLPFNAITPYVLP